MKQDRVVPGEPPRAEHVGTILTRDLTVAGERWSKGRALSALDLERLAMPGVSTDVGTINVLRLDPGELHEDVAARRLAAAVGGPGLTAHGPAQSRIDLRAAHDGVLHVAIGRLERLNRIDPVEVFTAFDGSVVAAGDLVASVKIAPHLVAERLIESAERIAAERGDPLVRVAPFLPRRVAVVAREALHPLARERFESSVRAKVESLGSTVTAMAFLDDDAAVEGELRRLLQRRQRVDLILTAGGGSTDPSDPFFLAIDRLGGRVVRHGVPAHPGSMLWLARVGRVGILGLPTCGAYSLATAADLVLPRLLTGERPGPRLVSRLGHGGILTRDQRFRFPPYARKLEAPGG